MLSNRLERRVLSEYGEYAELVLERLATLSLPAGKTSWNVEGRERIQAAVILASSGDLRRFEHNAAVAESDWRDVLVFAGLANEDWRERLTDALGESSESTST